VCSADPLVIKINAAGVTQWAVTPGGEAAFDVVIDPAGDVYIAGTYRTTTTIGSTTMPTAASGKLSGFVAKLSGANGGVLWAVPVSNQGGTHDFSAMRYVCMYVCVCLGCMRVLLLSVRVIAYIGVEPTVARAMAWRRIQLFPVMTLNSSVD
jgi:hypothetical protein